MPVSDHPLTHRVGDSTDVSCFAAPSIVEVTIIRKTDTAPSAPLDAVRSDRDRRRLGVRGTGRVGDPAVAIGLLTVSGRGMPLPRNVCRRVGGSGPCAAVHRWSPLP